MFYGNSANHWHQIEQMNRRSTLFSNTWPRDFTYLQFIAHQEEQSEIKLFPEKAYKSHRPL